MSILRANGLAVHVEQLRPPEAAPGVPGGGPTAVLIHGLATDNLASWYLSMAHPLAAAGLRVIMYDLRGHGRSERPPAGYTLDHFVDDLAALLAVLDVTGPVHLLGNSFGGTIAFGYAARHPEQVAAIAAVESSPPTAAWFGRVAKRLDAAAAQLTDEHVLARISVERGERASRRARTAREVLVATSLTRDLPASRLPAEERIAAVRCPGLWVYGGSSAVVELAPDVERLLPHARIVTVPGQRHSILIDQPDTVRDIVLSWLRQDCGLHPGPAAAGRDGPDQPPSPVTLH
ncbi:alpha/beta fold hydrolase [Micromonospora sagamiensis]|uniref:Alpha-beta hydrolase superfamily lysophospholipase n=1 Tax=Micromonospora sagamiensis TaxID=47875 RepID=A0A562WEN9_9ACTN|nr:alpha/beta hydrolase [Micromonospora sagamiensis]TWJ28648.1 alpha-beta hydrolase superfamily lysophospholipase [Micromonospora sagamiensis]BCL12447.1 alpha/beta hydrolase [Micromonospora sagamiensis]